MQKHLKKNPMFIVTLVAIAFVGVFCFAQANAKQAPVFLGKPIQAMDPSVAEFKPLAAPTLWPRY